MCILKFRTPNVIVTVPTDLSDLLLPNRVLLFKQGGVSVVCHFHVVLQWSSYLCIVCNPKDQLVDFEITQTHSVSARWKIVRVFTESKSESPWMHVGLRDIYQNPLFSEVFPACKWCYDVGHFDYDETCSKVSGCSIPALWQQFAHNPGPEQAVY